MRSSVNQPSFAAAALACIACAAALLTSGCAAPKAPETVGPDPAAVRLQSMLSRTDSLTASSRSADAAQAAAKPQAATKALASEQMTLSFAGNAPELLRPLAAARGLALHVMGPQPHLPLFVVVDQTGVSFEDVLRDVAAQFGQRAQLALTDTAIEIRYRPVTQ